MVSKRLNALLLCLLLLLSACGQGAAESVPELTPEAAPQSADAVNEESAPAETPVPVPEKLALSYKLPEADDSLPRCFSGADEQDCAFSYPDNCDEWVEEGVIRLSPRNYFARVFLSSVEKDGEDAPEDLLALLDTAKWNSTANEMTVGGRYGGLRMSNWKYDTYRRWIVWETDARYYTLYASCFDRYADRTNAILDAIASSFVAGDELVSASAERGALLRYADGVRLCYSDASIGTTEEDAPALVLELEAENSGAESVTLMAADAILELKSGESALWPITVLLTEGETTLHLDARSGGESLPGFGLDIMIKES